MITPVDQSITTNSVAFVRPRLASILSVTFSPVQGSQVKRPAHSQLQSSSTGKRQGVINVIVGATPSSRFEMSYPIPRDLKLHKELDYKEVRK